MKKKKTNKKIARAKKKKIAKPKKKLTPRKITRKKNKISRKKTLLTKKATANFKITKKKLKQTKAPIMTAIKKEKINQDFLVKEQIQNQQMPQKVESKNVEMAKEKINDRQTDSQQIKIKYVVSRHIVDLKKIQTAKQAEKEVRGEKINAINQVLFKKFFKAGANGQNNGEKISEKAKKITSKISGVKFPAKNLPKFNWPKISWPKFKMPEIGFNPPTAAAKAITSFIVVCLILTGPLFGFTQYQNLLNTKESVLNKIALALSHLSLSGQTVSAHDLYYTQHELNIASENFQAAQDDLQNINIITDKIIKLSPLGQQYSAADKLIEAGKNLSESAAAFSAALEKFNLSATSLDSLNLTDKISTLKDSLNLILPDLKTAESDISSISPNDIPQEYQDEISLLQSVLPKLETSVKKFINYSNLILEILGQNSLKRYLLIFQNTDEIRPTGGFIGSYALVNIDKGNLESISIPGGGPYDLKAGLKINISAPAPLRIMNQRWEFQDANWFANLPTSAEKLTWLYEKSGGPTVDGLIFINSSFVEDLLKITGPIEMPEYNKTITSENFVQEIQQNVEFDYNKTDNKPKQIIADLAPKILNKLMEIKKDKITDSLDLLLNGLNQKDIQLYFSNYSLEKFVLKNNWGGQMQKTSGDYLDIVSTNIAGEKTDAKITESANLKVDIQSDGSIINTVEITKTHNGTKGEPLYGVDNLDYLRIFTPKGSEFVSATGFELMDSGLFENADPQTYLPDEELASIDNTKKVEPLTQTEIFYEGDKTVFADWMRVKPGETKTVTLSYKLPFKLNLHKNQDGFSIADFLKNTFNIANDSENIEKYSLLWQKQSGRNCEINISINFPENFEYQLIYPNNLLKNNNSFNFSDILNSDKFLAVTFKKL